ncbi:MAG TPA: hypothetical protein VNO50_23325 [Pyrinomonadaceae bacterium]|nr:hypothetical protein [Pyrinomonadaceae bacterium]
MKRLLLLVITMLCPLAIARGQYVNYGPCRCPHAQAQSAYARAQRAQADAYAYQRAQAQAVQRWQAGTYQRAQAQQRAWAEAYQRQQAAAYGRAEAYQRAWAEAYPRQQTAYGRTQAYQRARAEAYPRQQTAANERALAYQRARAQAYMRSQAQGGAATQPQRQASLLPLLMMGGRAVAGTAAGTAVRQYFKSPERRREAVGFGLDVVNAVKEIRDRPEPTRQGDRHLERAAVRSVPGESSGIRSRIGELAPRIDRSDLGRFAGWGSKGLNDRIGSGQKETKGRQDRSRSDSTKSGNTPARSKDIKDWQPRG